MKNIPKKIYLQIGEDNPKDEDFNELNISWCTERVNDNDLEYVLNQPNKMKTYIDISPAKDKRVCQNCKYFEKIGVHLGMCYNRKKYTEKMDWQTCNRIELK